jgi:hypothetical protein
MADETAPQATTQADAPSTNPLVTSVKPYASAAWSKLVAFLNMVWSSVRAVWLPANYPALAAFFSAGVFFATPVMHRLERHGLITPVLSEKLANAPLAADRTEVILSQIQQLALRQATLADYLTKKVDEIGNKAIEASRASTDGKAALEGVNRQLADLNAMAGQLAAGLPFARPAAAAPASVPAPQAPEAVRKVKTAPVKPAAAPAPVQPLTEQPPTFPWSLFSAQQ